ASLGLYWAAWMPTAQSAGVGTALFGILAAAGPLLLGGLIALATDGRLSWFALPLGMSPPVALGLSAFSRTDWAAVRGSTLEAVMYFMAAGAAVSVVASATAARRLWRGACYRFPRSVGRR